MKKNILLLIREEDNLDILLKVYPTDDIDILKNLLMKISIITKDVNNHSSESMKRFIELFSEEIFFSELFLRHDLIPAFLRIITNLTPKFDSKLLEMAIFILNIENCLVPPKILWTIAQSLQRIGELPSFEIVKILSASIIRTPNIKAKMNLSTALLYFLSIFYREEGIFNDAKEMSSITLNMLDLHSYDDGDGESYIEELRNNLTRIIFYPHGHCDW